MFIGSSREGAEIAEIFELNLRPSPRSRFGLTAPSELSEGNLKNLVEAGPRCDFAVLMLTSDDIKTERGQTLPSPDDNVIFELGYFMGLLGREQTSMVNSRDEPMDMPTDLA